MARRPGLRGARGRHRDPVPRLLDRRHGHLPAETVRGDRVRRGSALGGLSEDARSVSMAKGVVRVGVSLEPEILTALDRWAKLRNAASRSEAIRFLVRKELSETELQD